MFNIIIFYSSPRMPDQNYPYRSLASLIHLKYEIVVTLGQEEDNMRQFPCHYLCYSFGFCEQKNKGNV